MIAIFGLMRFMPRTRPERIKPDAAPTIAWSDIAGADEATEELREVVNYLRDPKRVRDLGTQVPKGILLHGPPATGKTLLPAAPHRRANGELGIAAATAMHPAPRR